MKPQLTKEQMEKCKLPELKEIAKKRGLRVSGKKDEIKQRIYANIIQHEKSTLIQKIFRGHIARLWMRLKVGISDNAPVNDTDFFTLEPISEMEFIYYLHYTETASNTSYVFNINSLINLVAKTGKMENPYTREDLHKPLNDRLMQVITLTFILFPKNELTKRDKLPDKHKVTLVPAIPINPTANYTIMANNLFVKIDSLGNYTNVAWFNSLSSNDLCMMIVRLCNFWGHIDRRLKVRICPRTSPFSVDNLGIESMNPQRSIAENRAIAIRVGEMLVCSGATEEYRILGAMYFLTGLVLVSIEAREQMPWLYDNYFAIVQQQNI